MIGSPYLEGRDRYERATEGWVDNTHEDAFTHTVRLTDPDHTVEVTAVCTVSPGYEVRQARARIVRGDADPMIAADFSGLGGARMVAGFTRRLADLCGRRAGAGLFVDAGIEIARLARQTAKVPAAMTAGFAHGDARRCWDLDTASWQDLPNSCFTYGAAGRALLGSREVTASATLDLYTPPPGARKIFVRRRLSRLVRTGRRLHLFHSLHDNVHGFDVHYEIDLDSGHIAAADSVTSRLPYLGICNEPQAKIAALIGQPADRALRRGIQGLIGGEAGCAQLYDLTADLLKLLVLG
jgi:Protein of unknown function (DUF2889)